MIPENELRIGNWFEWIGIASMGRGYDQEKRPGQYCNFKDPIPLTPEILERCGFEKSTAWYRLGSHAVNPTVAYLYEYKNIPIKEVSFLHELQNLYFAITNKELQVDFSTASHSL